MSRLPPKERREAGLDGELLDFFEETWGFSPNSMLTLAHVPGLAQVCTDLAVTVMQRGKVPLALKWLVAHVTSRAAGCRYCSAHSGYFSNALAELDPEKIRAVWEFETSPHFTDAERAALRVAAGAGVTPNAVTDEDFEDLRVHFDDRSVAEIVAVISLFGFFNRWNDTMNTEVESGPLSFEDQQLGGNAIGTAR